MALPEHSLADDLRIHAEAWAEVQRQMALFLAANQARRWDEAQAARTLVETHMEISMDAFTRACRRLDLSSGG